MGKSIGRSLDQSELLANNPEKKKKKEDLFLPFTPIYFCIGLRHVVSNDVRTEIIYGNFLGKTRVQISNGLKRADMNWTYIVKDSHVIRMSLIGHVEFSFANSSLESFFIEDDQIDFIVRFKEGSQPMRDFIVVAKALNWIVEATSRGRSKVSFDAQNAHLQTGHLFGGQWVDRNEEIGHVRSSK